MAAWEAAVLAAGGSAKSLPLLQEHLQVGTYDEGYIRYVLDTIQVAVQAGKVERQGGAVFKALMDGYLLDAYRKGQQASGGRSKRIPTPTNQQTKWRGELEDARKSLVFVQTTDCYNEQTRPAAMEEVLTKIAQLEAALEPLAA